MTNGWTKEHVLYALHQQTSVRVFFAEGSLDALYLSPSELQEGDRQLGWRSSDTTSCTLDLAFVAFECEGKMLWYGKDSPKEEVIRDARFTSHLPDVRYLVERPKATAKKDSRFPHSCPRCAKPAYIGFSAIECSVRCVNGGR